MRYSISVDWLELLCSGSILQLQNPFNTAKCNISDDITLYKTNEHINPAYYCSFNIYYKSKLMGWIFYATKNKFRFSDKDSSLLHIDNRILYEDNLDKKINFLVSTLGLRFLKYNSLHIAIDGYDILKEHNKLSRSNKFHRQVNIEPSTELNEKYQLYTYMRIGSRKSDKYIVNYCKEDLLESESKVYIKDFWEQNGLPIKENMKIDRLELRLNKAKMLRDFDTDFTYLSNPNYLAEYFRLYGAKYLSFTNSKKQIKSLIDWSEFDKIKIIKSSEIKHLPVTNSLKTTLKQLYLLWINTGENIYGQAFMELVQARNLVDFYYKQRDRWTKGL